MIDSGHMGRHEATSGDDQPRDGEEVRMVWGGRAPRTIRFCTILVHCGAALIVVGCLGVLIVPTALTFVMGLIAAAHRARGMNSGSDLGKDAPYPSGLLGADRLSPIPRVRWRPSTHA